MEDIGGVILLAALYFALGHFRRMRTKWDIIVQTFPVSSEPQGDFIIGTQSEYISAVSKYPVINTVMKFVLCYDGLYVKYELFFEWPKYYKPVLIPWSNIFILPANEFEKHGFDKYQIYNNNTYLGQIKIQPYVSKEILNYIEINKIKIIKK